MLQVPDGEENTLGILVVSKRLLCGLQHNPAALGAVFKHLVKGKVLFSINR
jgi:hypothetical protein